jgi:Ca-activated chloride channel family protein
MDRPDPAPSRIQRARLTIADLAELREGQPLGLIAYAGSAHLVLPPTRDTEVVARMAAEISPAIMPVEGDRLDLALRKAGEVLSDGGSGGAVLVMADSFVGDPRVIQEAHRETGRYPVSFLAVDAPDSPERASLRAAARVLGATVQPLTADDADVRALTRAAARALRWRQAGDAGDALAGSRAGASCRSSR